MSSRQGESHGNVRASAVLAAVLEDTLFKKISEGKRGAFAAVSENSAYISPSTPGKRLRGWRSTGGRQLFIVPVSLFYYLFLQDLYAPPLFARSLLWAASASDWNDNDQTVSATTTRSPLKKPVDDVPRLFHGRRRRSVRLQVPQRRAGVRVKQGAWWRSRGDLVKRQQ